MNASVTTTANYITDQQYTYKPMLADLVNKVCQVAEAVCQYLSEQPTSRRRQCTSRNRNFYHLESIEADYVTHIIQGLQQGNPQSSLVLLHDGLLLSPLPTQSTLARLHHEALKRVGLRSDDTPFLRVTSLVDTYTLTIRQLPPTSAENTQALHAAIAAVNLEHLRQMPGVPQTLGRTTTPPLTTAATLHAYFSRTTRPAQRPPKVTCITKTCQRNVK